ncbi:MAG TPA: hypothetical protein VNH84_17430, partial [Candidatus Saccharimonadales bacterium]|nr:hypothetical protein [Candidatus Saccharimonadales bacterium]
IVTSPDGVQWTRCRSATLQTLTSVTYGAGTYIAVGEAGTILASPDGTTWQQVRSCSGESLNAVTVANTRFVAVGSGGRITVSADGTRWVNLNSGTTATFSRISCLRGRSVITGPGPGVIWISQDGLSWSVEPGGCVFVAGPSDGGSVLAIRYQQQLLVPIVTRMKVSNNPAGVPPSSRPSDTSGIPQGAGR